MNTIHDKRTMADHIHWITILCCQYRDCFTTSVMGIENEARIMPLFSMKIIDVTKPFLYQQFSGIAT